MSVNEHIDELLSGFLDGELTEDEMREVRSAMAADARLGLKVEQLRQLGDELRRLPQEKLPRNFAARVLAMAQVEASNLPAIRTTSVPSWVLTNASDSAYVVPARPVVTERRASRRTASISLTAAAAS